MLIGTLTACQSSSVGKVVKIQEKKAKIFLKVNEDTISQKIIGMYIPVNTGIKNRFT